MREPDQAIRDLSDLLTAWLPSYKAIEGRIDAILTRDVELRQKDRERLGPVELIEATTNGIRWLSEPGVRRVVLPPATSPDPSTSCSPRRTGGCSATPSPTQPSMRTTPSHLRPPSCASTGRWATRAGCASFGCFATATGICPRTAERLSLSKPTVKHHLAQLRAAGLVTRSRKVASLATAFAATVSTTHPAT